MNLEHLNVAELSSRELVETTGGKYWWQYGNLIADIFAVTPEAQRKLESF
ncbi:hypothetical protein [Chitinophaga japonensis]|uniref:Uncharacterized protein n=1 Tax=Chitinophaga japonensis TaxID=104662 RepID=A0A562SM41_CHIJA|nr:hypothetical protein [Chitinophaga japonensis]TWI82409.1 hypothetical protein LX66_4981 [Chitinophaga japonensis]